LPLPRKTLLSTILFLSILSIPGTAVAQNNAYTPENLNFTVYRDGGVHTRYILIVNSTWPTITVPLFGSEFEDLTVVDENETVLSYTIYDSTMEIHTLGASKVSIEYDTQDLTTKDGGLWSFSANTPIGFSIKLPENSTVIDLTTIPTEIRTEAGSPVLLMQAGDQKIAYILGAQPKPEQPPSLLHLIIIGVAGGSVIVGLALIFTRRSRRIRWDAHAKHIIEKHPDLRPDELTIINYLAVSGGSALEAHIRSAIGLPKSTTWRLVKGLEEKGVVVVEQIGQQNYVKLRQDSADSNKA
jgi:uncharacterized membrane protein